jgi:Ser-tRNA(Ala) deacylase AlaX
LFYPTQGGQECDHGILNINNVEYKVVDCIKVGKCAVHVLDKELPGEKKRLYRKRSKWEN